MAGRVEDVPQDPKEVFGRYLTPTVAGLMGLMTIIVTVRLYARAYVQRTAGVDDWLIIPAFLGAIAVNITHILSERNGWGHHNSTLSENQWVTTHQLMFAVQVAYTISVAMTKLSILSFYRRICTTRTFGWGIRITEAFLMIWMVGFMTLICVQCRPLSAYWNFGDWKGDRRNAKCLFWLQVVLYLAHGVSNFLVDVVVMVLPINTFRKLNIPGRQKFGLIGVFMLGTLVCAATALRIVSIYQVSKSKQDDISWYGYNLWLYTSIETNIGVIIASIPAVKYLIDKMYHTAVDVATHSRSGRHGTKQRKPGNTTFGCVGEEDAIQPPPPSRGFKFSGRTGKKRGSWSLQLSSVNENSTYRSTVSSRSGPGGRNHGVPSDDREWWSGVMTNQGSWGRGTTQQQDHGSWGRGREGEVYKTTEIEISVTQH